MANYILRRCSACGKFRRVGHNEPYNREGWQCGKCEEPDELPTKAAGQFAINPDPVKVGSFSLWRPFLVKLALWANR